MRVCVSSAAVAALLCGVLLSCVQLPRKPAETVSFSRLPDLTPPPAGGDALGLAGTFAGVHNGALIIAGGANFPLGWPKTATGTTAPKVYHRDVYVLVPSPSGLSEMTPDGDPMADSQAYAWHTFADVLPHGFSYGVSIPTDDGLICYGGEWKAPLVRDPASGKLAQERHLSARGFVLRWEPDMRQVTMSDRLHDDAAPLPDLTRGCALFGAARIGTRIYAAGGDTANGPSKQFLVLDLARASDEAAFRWTTLPSWPGPARMKHVVAAQSDGSTDCIYLFSGTGPDGARLTDAYRFSPGATGVTAGQAWLRLADVGQGTPEGTRCVAAAPGIACAGNLVLVLGGDDGAYYQRSEWTTLQANLVAARKAGGTEKLEALNAEMDRQMMAHPGFRRDILAYHTVSDTWTTLAALPAQPDPIRDNTVGNHVTTNVVQWGDVLVMPTGEVRPGVRSPRIWVLRLGSGGEK